MVKRLILVNILFNSIAIEVSPFTEDYPLTVFNWKNISQFIHQEIANITQSSMSYLQNFACFIYNTYLEGIIFSEEYCWLEKYLLHNLNI